MYILAVVCALATTVTAFGASYIIFPEKPQGGIVLLIDGSTFWNPLLSALALVASIFLASVVVVGIIMLVSRFRRDCSMPN
jgi:purine-cytosine permease-like protein